ncbi:hypothetical protein IV67_GL001391 [Weissella minor]|uniref:Uncharacterized protein n=1 Tax=Weissella minor TaxID=1620 RepID=A0A0R2JKA4_9LACO|nr:hypothetical protein IV67_GL001391 [Weissella minor]
MTYELKSDKIEGNVIMTLPFFIQANERQSNVMADFLKQIGQNHSFAPYRINILNK